MRICDAARSIQAWWTGIERSIVRLDALAIGLHGLADDGLDLVLIDNDSGGCKVARSMADRAQRSMHEPDPSSDRISQP